MAGSALMPVRERTVVSVVVGRLSQGKKTVNLRKLVVGAALGASVLTAVPALIAPQAAYAGCWGDYWSDCTPDYPDPYPPGDGGGGSDDGSGGSGDDGGGDDGGGGGEVVIIEGKIDDEPAEPNYPGDPEQPTETSDSGEGGGGGGGGGDSVVKFREGPKAQIKQGCIRNNGSAPMKATQSAKYTVTYKVNAGVSASVEKALSVTLNVELNKSIERNLGFEVTIEPGQSWALDVEYQTVEYAVTTTNWLGQSTTDWVNVTQPTGNVTSVSC